MYKNIIVPLDGSDLAEKALPYAEKLAGLLGSEVTLIHVSETEEDTYDHMHQAYLEALAETTSQGAERYQKKASKKKIRVSSAHLVGHTAEQIVEYSDKEKSSLIIMTTHGQSSIRRWLIGSVADKVVKATTRPVMIIRAKDNHTKSPEVCTLKKVLVPLDGSKNSEKVIEHIREIASKLTIEVTLLHVVAPAYFFYSIPGEVINQPYTPEQMLETVKRSEAYLDTIGSELRDVGIKTYLRVEVGSPAEEINRIADDIEADVVVMSTHGHTGIAHWMLGSTADEVLNTGNTALMLVRAQDIEQEKVDTAISEDHTSVSSLVAALASDDGVLRVGARRSLVAKGQEAVGPLVGALSSRRVWVRWEAAKALGEIGDATATQALIEALEDKMFDVRWLAAEGLIDIGHDAVVPLLRALVKRPDSLWLREGAHHVLHDMPKEDLRDVLQPVLAAMEDIEPSLEIAPAAYAALERLTGGEGKRDG
jgi:nucleotide-binding universal stress UspA family protein